MRPWVADRAVPAELYLPVLVTRQARDPGGFPARVSREATRPAAGALPGRGERCREVNRDDVSGHDFSPSGRRAGRQGRRSSPGGHRDQLHRDLRIQEGPPHGGGAARFEPLRPGRRDHAGSGRGRAATRRTWPGGWPCSPGSAGGPGSKDDRGRVRPAVLVYPVQAALSCPGHPVPPTRDVRPGIPGARSLAGRFL